MSKLSEKTFCEFFAGIGLVHDALQSSGWRCVYANDIAESKADMYRRRFGEADYYHEGDIWETEESVRRIPDSPWLATASFPCTDMSLAGKRRGFSGEESSTFFGFAQVIDALQDRRPRILMLENVVGFMNSRGGADFQAVVQTLGDLGYWVDAMILDAKDFIPQSRPRLFVFGFDDGLECSQLLRRDDSRLGDPWRDAIEQGDRLRNDRLVRLMDRMTIATGWATLSLRPPKRTAYALIDYLDTDSGQDWWDQPRVDKHLAMMSDPHREEVESWRGGVTVSVATIFRRIRQGEQRAEVRRDGVAGCLRTPRGGSARQIVIAAGRGRVRMRWMSPREYARLQGAANFPLAKTDSASLFGFGDAVCTPVIRWIDAEVLTPVFEECGRLPTTPVRASEVAE